MDFNQPQPAPIVSSNGSIPNRPGENDVIVGANCNKHCGNIKFQQFIKAYKRARHNQKIEPADAVKEVVEFWRRLSPRGRFLAQNKGSNRDGQWHEVDDRQAMRIASFFLLNQGGGEIKRHELRRQKSIDAMRSRSTQNSGPPLMRSQSGPVSHVRRSMRGSGVSSLGGQDNPIQAQATGSMSQRHTPDMMSNFEPMPMGATSSSSMAWGKGQVHQQRNSLQEPVTSSSSSRDLIDQSLEPFDFNPLPFNPNKEPVDDFEPIQASFGNGGGTAFDSGKNNLDVSANAQFGGAPDQVQVSVNMVVNTMPQGFQRDNSVNTVTNIQIGTGAINDEKKQPIKPPRNKQGQNFQLMTDASNGFIHISAQSNANGSDESSMMKPGASQQQTGNLQMSFFGNQERGTGFNNNINDLNRSGGIIMANDQMINTMNGNVARNTSMMNRNTPFGNGNTGNGNVPANGNVMTANPNIPSNGNLMGGMPGQNMNMNMNVNVNMNMNNPDSSSSSSNNNNSNAGQNARWNKNEVANSVPCAASLVGSLFDDW